MRNAAGDMIPLRALVADVDTTLGPLSISRCNQAQAALYHFGQSSNGWDRPCIPSLPSSSCNRWFAAL